MQHLYVVGVVVFILQVVIAVAALLTISEGDLLRDLVASTWILLPNAVLAVTGIVTLRTGSRSAAIIATLLGVGALLYGVVVYGPIIAGDPFPPEAGVLLFLYPAWL